MQLLIANPIKEAQMSAKKAIIFMGVLLILAMGLWPWPRIRRMRIKLSSRHRERQPTGSRTGCYSWMKTATESVITAITFRTEMEKVRNLRKETGIRTIRMVNKTDPRIKTRTAGVNNLSETSRMDLDPDCVMVPGPRVRIRARTKDREANKSLFRAGLRPGPKIFR